jgi:hypothetical protein
MRRPTAGRHRPRAARCMKMTLGEDARHPETLRRQADLFVDNGAYAPAVSTPRGRIPESVVGQYEAATGGR